MKKAVFFMAFLLCTIGLTAQSDTYDFAEGDVLELGEASGSRYTSIDFPRKNMILKRGAIADFNNLVGKKLVIQEIQNNKEGEVIAILKRTDGLNFFRFFPQVTADLSKAIASGELKMIVDNRQGAIAQK